MLPSRSEYDILRPLYHGETQKFDEEHYRDAIEFLLTNHMIERVEAEDNSEPCTEIKYRITTLGKRAYEDCVNFLDEERRKDATLQTAKEAAQSSEKSSKRSFICSVLSVVTSILMLITTIVGLCLSNKYSNERSNQDNEVYTIHYECNDM